MNIKYQVFISSTYEDLIEEREQVIKAVLEMGHIPVGMEMFSAADEEQWKIITRQIDEVDYYVVIISHRYGSVTDGGISFTEKEYDYAVKKGVPVLGFIIDNAAQWSADKFETDSRKREALKKFKNKVKNKIINFWLNKNDLHAKFSISLMKAITTYPRIGWTRADEVAGPEVIKELTRLSSENSELRRELEEVRAELIERDSNRLLELEKVLKKNKREVYVWKYDARDWGKPFESSLYEIFKIIAPDLLIEGNLADLGRIIGFKFGKKHIRSDHPIPVNDLRLWLGDLTSLDLIKPSDKRHSVKDSNEYWMLSKDGKEFYSMIRRMSLINCTESMEIPGSDE